MPAALGDDPLVQLRTEWRRVGRSRAARAAVASLRDRDVALPAGVRDLCDVAEVLEPTGGLEVLERARLVSDLLALAGDPMVRRCLLQTLLPGIVSVVRQLQFGAGVADDARTFLADALGEAAALLCDWAGQRRRYAAGDILNALRCRLRRRMLHQKAHRRELVGDAAVLDGRHHDHPLSLVGRLAEAIDAGVTDVDLVYARVVCAMPVNELAASIGVTTGVLKRRLALAAAPFRSAWT